MNILETLAKKIRFTYLRIASANGSKQKKRALQDYYQKHPSKDREIEVALDYIDGHDLSTFPYPFREKYIQGKIKVHTDKESGLYYVERDGKRLFLCRSKTLVGAQHTYNSLLIEQDEESPHHYLTPAFNVDNQDVVVDIGCAEGILSLDLVEKARKIYLFECEEEWIEALQRTFAPWKEKVEIVRKYVSDTDEGQNITLDTFFKERPDRPTFIKMDVEGAEMQVLRGMESLLDTTPLKLAICTYHRQRDYEEITHYIAQRGMKYQTSEKYMLFWNQDDYLPPYFRRGLIRVTGGNREKQPE